jgi:predicted DNA-binding transcriptional regulator AlpA
MGRRVDVDQLVGTTEIAARLGVQRPQVVHDWRRRHPEFPKPVAVVSRVGLWFWPDVEKWARATGRLE